MWIVRYRPLYPSPLCKQKGGIAERVVPDKSAAIAMVKNLQKLGVCIVEYRAVRF